MAPSKAPWAWPVGIAFEVDVGWLMMDEASDTMEPNGPGIVLVGDEVVPTDVGRLLVASVVWDTEVVDDDPVFVTEDRMDESWLALRKEWGWSIPALIKDKKEWLTRGW